MYGLVLTEILVTIAAQFPSTICLSDFTDGSYSGSSNSTQVYIYKDAQTQEPFDMLRLPAQESWTFAELSEPFSRGAHFDDTGHTYRSLFPFRDEGRRTRLRKFRGPAHVTDLRVVCVLFLRLSRSSLIGNSWQAVAQAVSHDTLPMLSQGDSIKDGDIARRAGRQPLHLMRRGRIQRRPDGQFAFRVLDEGEDQHEADEGWKRGPVDDNGRPQRAADRQD
ncbi:hypothetical protein CDD83_1810 [Cordyceps sp. RAO-2017]|nr:hypothetical protein CDD83_1810 [Cordyceps sp. RAO-2017]